MRRAARVDAPQVEIVAALRAAGAIVVHLHQVGQGCPDLLLAAGGRFGLLELKNGKLAPSARKKTEAQIAFWDAMEGAGPMGMATDVESALRFLAMLRL